MSLRQSSCKIQSQQIEILAMMFRGRQELRWITRMPRILSKIFSRKRTKICRINFKLYSTIISKMAELFLKLMIKISFWLKMETHLPRIRFQKTYLRNQLMMKTYLIVKRNDTQNYWAIITTMMDSTMTMRYPTRSLSKILRFLHHNRTWPIRTKQELLLLCSMIKTLSCLCSINSRSSKIRIQIVLSIHQHSKITPVQVKI